jgi:hypothetical protein
VELLIADEKSGRAIARTPVDVTDGTSVTEALKKAFEMVGTPLEIRTDGGQVFSGTVVKALASLGVAHTHTVLAAGPTRAERQARS